jgi:pilus assembly protein CpaF
MRVEVVIRDDAGGAWKQDLDVDGPFTIGRDARCELRLESTLLSRRHAIVEVGARSLWVEDTSTNGTVAGTQILHRQKVEIPHNAPIVLGEFTLYVTPATPIDLAPAAVWGPPPVAPAPRPPPPAPAPPPPAPAPPARLAPPPPPPAPRRDAPPTIAAPPPAVPTGVVPPPVASAVKPIDAGKTERKAAETEVALRRSIHQKLLEHLDLATMDANKLDDPSLRPKVVIALRRIVDQLKDKIPVGVDRDGLVGELTDEALGLGPLERFLADASISEIMVVDANNVYVETGGKLIKTDARFTDDERVRAVIERIVTPLGRRIDESSPIVDARLRDGSRVNAVIRPLALRGSCITIRKFSKVPLTIEKLIGFGAMTPQIAQFLQRCVVAKKNIIISGGAGSGKTTLLNVLSSAIPEDERIVTIEDAAELQLKQPHVVSLETRPANMEGKGEYTIRDLVKNSLRMRPDRIVVGECRGGEALDMLQAMNTGHDGSLTTTHANSPAEAIGRLETLCLMAGVDLPARAIRDQIASSIHVIVQQSRFSDGSRRISAVSEVSGIDAETGDIALRPIFEYARTGTGPNGKVLGEFRATGYLPSFLDAFIVAGLVKPGEPYL